MKKYLYSINNNVLANELCKLEMETIFGQYEQYIITDINVAANKSAFIKDKLEIYNTGKSFEDLINQIATTNQFFETFKLTYIKNKADSQSYGNYIDKIKQVAMIINGEGDFKTPMHLLAIACIEDTWYFGKYEKNDYNWQINNKKPHSYSNAMSADLSRSIINIAMGNNIHTTIIDSCSGVGTIVIDGLLQGCNIEGTEINEQIGAKAQQNLQYFNLPPVIEIMDMHEIEKYYDVSILDIPYGIMSHTDESMQQGLITQCFKISEKLILLSSTDLNQMIKNAGFKLEKQIIIRKHNNAKFNRYISICSK